MFLFYSAANRVKRTANVRTALTQKCRGARSESSSAPTACLTCFCSDRLAGAAYAECSQSDSAEFRNALGVLIIGGILSSTFLTLLIVPVAYTLMADAYLGFGRLQARIRGVFGRRISPAE